MKKGFHSNNGNCFRFMQVSGNIDHKGDFRVKCIVNIDAILNRVAVGFSIE